jgi:hypothetical protein
MNDFTRFIVAALLGVALVPACNLPAQPGGPAGPPGPGPARGEPATTQPAGQAETPATQPADDEGQLKHVTVDREAGHVEVTAELIRREANWLELLATTPGSREHEALLTVKGKPSHVHLGLIMLGLEPGRPRELIKKKDGEDVQWITKRPKGPPLGIWLIYERGGKTRKTPANRWIWNREAERPLESNRWLFTGSEIVKSHKGKRFYLADRSGSFISLVNFGDDVLVRDTTATNRSDQEQWGANTKLLPANGATVTIRIKPLPKDQGEPQADSDSADENPAASENESTPAE